MAHVVAICGDLHCGSTVGLCPPEGLELDDGGMYDPSDAQEWLWQCWESAWKKAKSIIGRDKFTLVLNGDLIDGDHHRSSQIASPLTGIHARCAMESLRDTGHSAPWPHGSTCPYPRVILEALWIRHMGRASLGSDQRGVDGYGPR